jgi:hypothetical protein
MLARKQPAPTYACHLAQETANSRAGPTGMCNEWVGGEVDKEVPGTSELFLAQELCGSSCIQVQSSELILNGGMFGCLVPLSKHSGFVERHAVLALSLSWSFGGLYLEFIILFPCYCD